MNKPNLFKHATNELSQDAFLAWLFEYADEKYIDDPLHDCSIELLKKLFDKQKITFPSKVISLKVEKQETFFNVDKKKRSIDLLCFINNQYIVLIEDKTNTSDGRIKLNDYRKYIEKKYPTYKIVSIYFKTGFQLDFAEVHKAEYREFLRDEFLEVLSNHKNKIKNDIFCDYYNYLKDIESKTLEYKDKVIDEWDGYQWQGFYKILHAKLGQGNGGYVHNKSGGFWGFWWKGKCQNYHFQVEKVQTERKSSKYIYGLCIKIKKERSLSDRKSMYAQIEQTFSNNDRKIKFRKPIKFAKGQHMAIAVLNEEFPITSNAKVDVDATVQFIKDISAVQPL